jgi:hypothetical protein
MPNPFRHYEGVPVLDLLADPPTPETPALEVLQGMAGVTPARDGPTFLSQPFVDVPRSQWRKRVHAVQESGGGGSVCLEAEISADAIARSSIGFHAALGAAPGQRKIPAHSE